MKSFRFLAAAAVPLLLCASFAFAHDDAYLATQKAPNGGQLRMAGPYHYELVAGATASVYVTDHAGTPVPTEGAQGVVHATGNESSSVKLVPDGENRMKAVGASTWTNDATVVVSITFAGVQPAQARFAPQAAGAPESAQSHSAGVGHKH